MRWAFGCFGLLLSLSSTVGCNLGRQEVPSVARPSLIQQQDHGKDVWLNSTFGGEKYFSLILPAAPFDLQVGFDTVLATPRSQRFTRWGVINDPDCTDGDASTGFDRCADPHATGVVGIRRFDNPLPVGPRVLIGVACASCHAGLDPARPPADPNHPGWENIHLTVGNQYIDIAKIFNAHLSPSDPRYQVFHTWAPGTVDTTVLESDHINNPGMITPIFNVADRPYFHLHDHGVPVTVHRSGQGGEDDVGCEKSMLRVYFNIGMCTAECMVGHLANGPGGSQTPIDLDQCRRDCPAFRDAERNAGDLCAFLNTARPPKLDASYIDRAVVDRGKRVFFRACAHCHSNGRPLGHNVLSNDLLHRAPGPFADEAAGEIGTNSCRARTTNWQAGHIWAAFSSDEQKARGPGYYRNLPLLALWATAPFLHNDRLGRYTGDPSVAGRLAAYEDAMDQLLNPWKRDLLGSIQRTTQAIVLPTPLGNVPLPAGTPVATFANLDPAKPLNNLCPDLVENEGHRFGEWLSAADKYALKEFLKTQ